MSIYEYDEEREMKLIRADESNGGVWNIIINLFSICNI